MLNPTCLATGRLQSIQSNPLYARLGSTSFQSTQVRQFLATIQVVSSPIELELKTLFHSVCTFAMFEYMNGVALKCC